MEKFTSGPILHGEKPGSSAAGNTPHAGASPRAAGGTGGVGGTGFAAGFDPNMQPSLHSPTSSPSIDSQLEHSANEYPIGHHAGCSPFGGLIDVGHHAGAGSAPQTLHISHDVLVPFGVYEQPPTGFVPFHGAAKWLAAASHVALHCLSPCLAPMTALQPIAQEGFWHAEIRPLQQCPAIAHFSSQRDSGDWKAALVYE